jgi:histone acetyltransferase (RNA polymerase elongator complex component)
MLADIEDIRRHKKNIYEDEEVLYFLNDLIELIKIDDTNIDKLYNEVRIKHRICPSKSDLRNIYESHYPNLKISNNFKRWLIKKVMRSESGVLVVTIVTKPGNSVNFSCPEKCAYCPTETDLNGVPTQPKSYISTEPAMMRAMQHNFDIREQIIDRLKAYLFMGNIKKDSNKKKIEVILSGGTWDVLPRTYREQVINQVYWGFNTINSERPMESIEYEMKENETSNYGV